MADLVNVLNQLREERKQAQSQIQKLNGAIIALEGIVGRSNSTSSRNVVSGKRGVSLAARRRMARAQRARWAKVKSQADASQSRATAPKPTPVKRTMSAASRRKIAAAQRARWAKLKKAA